MQKKILHKSLYIEKLTLSGRYMVYRATVLWKFLRREWARSLGCTDDSSVRENAPLSRKRASKFAIRRVWLKLTWRYGQSHSTDWPKTSARDFSKTERFCRPTSLHYQMDLAPWDSLINSHSLWLVQNFLLYLLVPVSLSFVSISPSYDEKYLYINQWNWGG